MTQTSIIFIHNLQISARIGIHPHEYDSHQPIIINLSLNVKDNINPEKDQLKETIDYEAIAKTVETLALETHVQLVETLAGKIADHCLSYDTRIDEVSVKIEKPNALADAKTAGIIISKQRPQ